MRDQVLKLDSSTLFFFNIELDRSAKLINLQKEEFLIKLFHDGGPYHIGSEAYQTDRMKHLRWKVFRK